MSGGAAPQPRPVSGASDHMANTRTLLAWQRTAITVMALGFVVARFGLFMREFGIRGGNAADPLLSAVTGVLLVSAGVALTVIGLVRFVTVRRAIERDNYMPGAGFAMVAAAIVILSGVLLAGYLILSR